MATCTSEVEVRAPGQDLRATVRDEPAGTWVVNVWADEPAEGIPDYVCEVVRDRQAETGFRVRRLRPED
jgi:hypothetical protein